MKPITEMISKCRNKQTKDCFESCIEGYYINKNKEKIQISEMIQNCIDNTKSYSPDYVFELPPLEKKEKGEIEIRNETTIRGALRMVVEENKKNVCALNFANVSRPGGSVLSSANAQEEVLCRSSALYDSLIQKNDFYEYNQEKDTNIASNYLIYSPDCPTWKMDDYQKLDQPFLVSYLSAAAVYNNGAQTREEIQQIHDERIKFLLYCAICNGVKNIILGAFGCGSFKNNPEDISQSFKHWLVDENLKDYFESISFSIIERKDAKSNKKVRNIDIFAQTFDLPIIRTEKYNPQIQKHQISEGGNQEEEQDDDQEKNEEQQEYVEEKSTEHGQDNDKEEKHESLSSNDICNKDTLKIVTINVNSINAACKKGFLDYVKIEDADIICIQETKLHKDSSPGFDNYILDGYYGYFYNSEQHKGYAGTSIYTKIKPISIKPGFNDNEGRVILIEYSNFYLINTYVPNAGQTLDRLEYKIKTWNPKLKNLMDELSKTKLAILCGDLNVAHQPIDIYDPKGKEKYAGYTPEERESFDNFLKDGYTDVFRHLYPEKHQFSFFGYRFQMKAKGYGWRLDYFVIPTKSVDDFPVVDCLITNADFSDHLPCILVLNRDKMLTDADLPIDEEGVTVLNSGATFKKSDIDENDDDDDDKQAKPKSTKKTAKSQKKKSSKKKK